MLNRKQIFDTITNDGKIDVDGTEAQRIINRLMYLQSQNLLQTPCTALREHIAQKLNYWVEVDLEELTGHQRRQRTTTIKLCTEFLKLIDECPPVA